MINQEHEFIIIKKSYTYANCSSCEGTGIRKRTFRSRTYIEDCPLCEGSGRKRFERVQEYSLLKALEEIKENQLI